MKKFLGLIFIFTVAFAITPLTAQDKKEKSDVVIIIENTEEAPELSIVDNKLQVKNAPIGAKIEILTIVGSKVKELEIKTKNESFELNLPRAIYIFKLNETVRKFVIR
ncbi:hypothetical protein M2138_002066 [Dysgonomonadaceae bacterium PH5-43]|nr:hypothetical protein [Dysgonomonadaceae bacterium PH5-43]